MSRKFSGAALRFLSLLATFLLAIGLFSSAKSLGWLSPFGIDTESNDSQVINAIERTQEVSLLRLGIQGIKDETQSGTIFGQEIPFSEETVYLQYEFNAKLGIDGQRVNVTKTGESSYRITVPEFTYIGISDPVIRLAVESDGALSFTTPEVDKIEMINEILDVDGRELYLTDNEDVLRDQTSVFYDGLIKSIDPAASTEYVFN